MSFTRAYGTVIAALALACVGCSNMSLHATEPSVPTTKAISTLSTDLATTKTTVTPVAYATLGYSLVDSSCEDYFGAIVKADNGLKMTKADIVATGSAASVIAALASAPQKAIGITAATFGLTTAAVDNYEQYAFATPYPVQTHQLVRKALVAYRGSVPPTAVVTMEDAYDKVAGYARNCTFAGIADLAEQAIAKSTPGDTNTSKPLFSSPDRSISLAAVNPLVAVAGKVPLDEDYATVAALGAVKNDQQFQVLFKTLSDGVDPKKIATADPPTIATETTGFKQAVSLLKLLANSNSAFAAAVNAKVDAVTTPVHGADPTPPAKPLPSPAIGIM